MTNHWNDLANSDCILIMGSNPAENHPISFKWVLKAQDKGAKVVSVDPRFTHSSSKADFYVQLRVGTDIAFLGGMIDPGAVKIFGCFRGKPIFALSFNVCKFVPTAPGLSSDDEPGDF